MLLEIALTFCGIIRFVLTTSGGSADSWTQISMTSYKENAAIDLVGTSVINGRYRPVLTGTITVNAATSNVAH